MLTPLDTIAVNRSTYSIIVTFTDVDGEAVVPTSATWSLTDEYGNIINDRDEVELTISSSIAITLSGDDIDQEDSSSRYLSVEAVYDSDTYGSSLPSRQQASFSIEEWITKEVSE